MDFQWDEDNLRHVLVESPRGVTPRLLSEIADGAPKLFQNSPLAGRTGSHLMVGPDAKERFWTIVLLYMHDDIWRPLTGWPSTQLQIRLYRQEGE